MSSRGMDMLATRGYFTEDVEGIFVGNPRPLQQRKYRVQVSGEYFAPVYWTEWTTLTPQKILRDLESKYPDAMIIKTIYK